jgi:queuine/archaeosine tRNA-ribosyltransferase
MADIRESISRGRLTTFVREFMVNYAGEAGPVA